MTIENLNDLLITKFFAAKKEAQAKLLSSIFQNTSHHESIMNILNGKPLTQSSKHFTEGDYVYILLDIKSYPKPNKEYYKENDLILNDQYIRVQVKSINFMTQYATVEFVGQGSDKVCEHEIWYDYIPDQEQINII
jgi:hypothetical protein